MRGPLAEPAPGATTVTPLTEGTYPHSHGGVSVWCDQLVTGMPDITLRVIAVTGTGREALAWPIPPQVTAVSCVPLWGPPSAVRATPPRSRAMRRFLTGYERFLLAPLDPARERLFAPELYRLAEYAEHGTLSAAMASEPAVRLLVRLWNRQDLPTAPARPTLYDALTATELLEHALRPLVAVPPAAPPLGAVRLLAVLAPPPHCSAG
ncbi:DUF3492 domain-containing protein [Streptomyces cucumeris]|uniref:DUF3492 domain-containing protein n=1 Tax=Streptomyces cucumeris TaxID=2962890 RepID=UPI003EBA0A98